MKVKRVPEAWGRWENRSGYLHMHPLNSGRPGYLHGAYVNLLFSVQVSTEATKWGEVTHLWIRRHDHKPLRWRDMQRIKNELVGEGRVGVEVYPAQTDVVDAANMYHLWVLPEGFQLPFSLRSQNA